MDTARFLKVPGLAETEMDKYTASIELSNACRQFYQSRLEAAHCYKSRWERHALSTRCDEGNDNFRSADDHSCSTAPTQRRQSNSIDEAMHRLRAEMTSLMDQDLSLMKQLLTLNETIEELKWQRRYYYSRTSSADLRADSDCSISDTEMYAESEDESHRTATTSRHDAAATASSSQTPVVVLTSPSSSSSTAMTSHRKQDAAYGCRGRVTAEHASCRASADLRRDVNSGVKVATASEATSGVKVYHGEQDSFDSGFHEPSSEEEVAVS